MLETTSELRPNLLKVHVWLTGVCLQCESTHQIEVHESDYYDWRSGMPIQEAFPYLSIDEREILISGICGSCWDKIFPKEGE